MEKTSLKEIANRKQILQSLLDNERKYDFDLVYSINKNIQIINNEIKEVQEILPKFPDEVEDYQKEKFELFKDNEGTFTQSPNGGIVLENTEILEDEEVQKELKDINDKYEGVLKKQEEIAEERAEKINNKVVEIEWYPIKKEYFPKEIQPNELPIEILDLIEE